jgi:hypothetical protein
MRQLTGVTLLIYIFTLCKLCIFVVCRTQRDAGHPYVRCTREHLCSVPSAEECRPCWLMIPSDFFFFVLQRVA